MLYQKSGLPQESEIVVCTVTRVMSHSVFVSLNAYQNKSAMLHISEVSPGRIRNLRDYVKEGKVVICKVLSVNPEKEHIDVSLRRVGESMRMQMQNMLKKEANAEKILEHFCKEKKIDVKKAYDKLYKIISKDYEQIHEAFLDYVTGEYAFEKSGFTPKQHDEFLELIKSRIKPPQVEITGKITSTLYDGDGVQKIRALFSEAKKIDQDVTLTYNGGGHYNIRCVKEDFKEAIKSIKKVVAILEKGFEGGEFKYVQADGRQIS